MKFIYNYLFTTIFLLGVFSLCEIKAQQSAAQEPTHNEDSVNQKYFSGRYLKNDVFNQGSYNNVLDQMRGRFVGLSISRPGGDPNGFYQMRLRGLRTLSGNSTPTMIIDGLIEAYPENLDINDIESIRLISDASETSGYGIMGGAGVIVIETKGGIKGKPRLNYNTRLTAEKVAGKPIFMDADEWRSLSSKLGFGTDLQTSTDWSDEITRTALSQVHNLSVSGGSNLTAYRASVNYRGGDGILIHSGYSQINGRLSFSQKAFKEKLVAGINLAGTQRKSHFGFSDAFKYALISNPTSPVRSDDPQFDNYDGYFNQFLFDYYNPVEIASLNRNEGLTRLLNLNARITYRIAENVAINGLYAIQNFSSSGIQYFDPHSLWGGINRDGLAQRQDNNSINRQFTLKMDYSHKWGEGIFYFNAGYENRKFKTDGHSAEKDEIEIMDLSFKNLFNQIDFNVLNEGTFYESKYTSIGFFANAGIESKLWFLRFNGFYQGSSIMLENKWSFYKGALAGFDLARVINPSARGKLILRTGIGTSGNAIPVSYLSHFRYGSVENLQYNGYFLTENQTGITNPDLKNEKLTEFNIGMDFLFFEGLLSGSIEFYSAITKDPIVAVEVPVPPNVSSPVITNIGKIKDSGIEFVLGSYVKKSGWSNHLMFTAAYCMVNKPVSLTAYTDKWGKISYGDKNLGNLGSPGNNQVPLVRVSENQPFGQLLALEYKGIDPSGNPLMEDQPGTSAGIDQSDRIVAGNGLPKFLLGINNDFTFKKWDLRIFVRGVFGHSLVNTYRAFYESPIYLTTYNLTKTAKNLKNLSTGAYMNSSSWYSSYHIEKASFISLDNLSIGYTLPFTEHRNLNSIRVFLAGNNLFYITGYNGVDPNPRYGDSYNYTYDPLIPGIERTNTWFRTRSFTIGASVTF